MSTPFPYFDFPFPFLIFIILFLSPFGLGYLFVLWEHEYRTGYPNFIIPRVIYLGPIFLFNVHGGNAAFSYSLKKKHKFSNIEVIPTLIVNALNDPFIADGCYPIKETSNSKYVYLEMPKSGGHVGFIQFKKDRSYWSEKRTIEFLKHH